MIKIKVSKPDLRNLNEQTYLYLHQLIITHKLKPGSRINYDDLVEDLGISKTPLRDALNRLAQDGLVQVKPRSGTFVSVPKIEDMKELYDIRKALEREAVALSINRIPNSELERLLDLNNDVRNKFVERGDFQSFLNSDREIHQTIIKYSSNSRLIGIMDNLNSYISWSGYLIIDKIRERIIEATDHHKDILEAMLGQNMDLAMRKMEYHINETRLQVIKDLSE